MLGNSGKANGGARMVAAGALGALFAAGLTGCYVEGGAGASLDRHVYVSTEFRPVTLTVFDANTRQPQWSYDVPVGKKLVLEFYDDAYPDEAYTTTKMKWDVWDQDQIFGAPGQEFKVTKARYLDYRLRPTPEAPGKE